MTVTSIRGGDKPPTARYMTGHDHRHHQLLLVF
jgi:hypothetical protein